MIVGRNILKQWFSRGKKPTEEQFAALIDSFLHKSEDAISGDCEVTMTDLDNALNNHDISNTAHTDIRELIMNSLDLDSTT